MHATVYLAMQEVQPAETLVAMTRKYGGCSIPDTPSNHRGIGEAPDVLGKRLVASVKEAAAPSGHTSGPVGRHALRWGFP